MLRSLWTASSGMLSQQTNLDTIANNLSNINTIGYKKETTEFKSLLYQTLKETSTDNEGNPKAIGIQVGSGVRNSAITSRYTQGSVTETGNPFDIAIDGDGFFMVQTSSEEDTIAYTRNGHFNCSIGIEEMTLCTTDGYPVLSEEGTPITFNKEWNTAKIKIDDFGQVLYVREAVQVINEAGEVEQLEDAKGNIIDESGEIITDAANNPRLEETPEGEEAPKYTLKDVIYEDTIARIGIAQFNNPSGLTKLGGSLLQESLSSGEARLESQDANLRRSTIRQGHLEASNVQAVDEMVNMIVAQRAYELNSKAITASDEMLQQANNLRR